MEITHPADGGLRDNQSLTNVRRRSSSMNGGSFTSPHLFYIFIYIVFIRTGTNEIIKSTKQIKCE